MKQTSRITEANRLSELMFGTMRLLKHQLAADGYSASSYLHLEVLRFLDEADTSDMHDIADYLRVTAPTATGLVNTLVRQGLVKRKPDAADRRRVLLEVSPKGKRTIEDARARREAAFARVTEPLTAADRKEFARILTVITKRS